MTGSVVAFPNTPRVDRNTKGRAVVVAPLHGNIVAWVETERGWAILEDSPDWRHSVSDGRTYAARFDIPFRFQGNPLDTGSTYREPERGGEITVTPSDHDGGSWDVVHTSADRSAATTVANRFSFEQAVLAARQIASAMGATFEDDEGNAA